MQNQAERLMNAAAKAALLAQALPAIKDGAPKVDPNEPIADDLARLPRDGSELSRQQDAFSEYTRNALFRRADQSRRYAQALRSVAEAADALLDLARFYEAAAQRCDSTIAEIDRIRAKGAAARAARIEREEQARPENVLKRLEALEGQAQQNN